ncbi:MAG: hypothetical protein H7Y30_05320 [Pyrinomonadaceae bacterium]|nr:hypothetical protein [Pyrinomonadaceae bacterium]
MSEAINPETEYAFLMEEYRRLSGLEPLPLATSIVNAIHNLPSLLDQKVSLLLLVHNLSL